MMNIDTERVILAVQMHPVIWDTNFDSYKNKDARQAAWMEICTNLVDNFNEMTSGKKKSVVVFLQKKWKSVRDYYIRDKKREIETGGSAMKKRKINPYFKLLEFLNDPKDSNQGTTESSPNLASSDLLAYGDDKSLEKDDSSDDASSCDQSGSRATETVLTSTDTGSSRIMVMRRWTKIIEDNDDDDPNRHFLMSLLPEMSTMTERQNFKFRFEIMNVLNKIKYQVEDYK